MKKRADMARSLREKGLTYQEIGETLGISKQAVYQDVNKKHKSRNNVHISTLEKVRYLGLRQWMMDNYVSVSGLARLIGVSHLYASLCGDCEPKKSTIDAILSVTGMTYEECFKEN